MTIFRSARLLACLLLLTFSPAWTLAADRITVLTWEAFVSPKVLATFKNREHLQVELIEFSSPEERERLLKEKADRIDIVVADTIWTSEYKRRGLLEKIDTARVPAVKHALTHWRTDAGYAVPYMWGHTGIAWRTDRVTEPVTSYSALFKLARAHPGKVSLLDDPHEALRAALYAFGSAPWAMNNPEQVKKAHELLKPHRRDLRIVGSELGEDSAWLDGSLIAGQAFNGDIAYLRDNFQAPLAFAVPSPGCMIFNEQLVLLKSSRNKEAAYRFMALITSPAHAARNAEFVRYAPSNPLAVDRLGEAFRNDPIIRPTFGGLEGCYFYNAFDAATQAALDAIRL